MSKDRPTPYNENLDNSKLQTQQSIIRKSWYAVYVRSHHEKKVYHLFLEKGIEASLPLIKTTRQWSDRKKKIESPLFRGYVFVRIDIDTDKLNILQTNGVIKFIAIRDKPSRIPDKQIYWIQIMLKKSFNVQNEKEIPVGQKIRVITGPFKGLEGTAIRVGNRSRIVVFVESIMYAVSIEINSNCLTKI